jgi:hypothetical protein
MAMKKWMLAILSCLYLVATSGMQIQHHYCMGRLKATSIGFLESKKCDTCGMEAGSSRCCHDESQWVKVKDNHAAAILNTDIPTPFVLCLPPVVHFFARAAIFQAERLSVNNHSPPPLLLANRQALFCLYRI